MDDDRTSSPDRRTFLRNVSVAAASLPVAAAPRHAQAAPPAATNAVAEAGSQAAAAAATPAPAGYQILSLEEAAFTEALVDHMWPQDALSASGTELGIATFIDRQLAGAFGQGDRLYLHGPFRRGKAQHGYQLPLTPAEYYKSGLSQASSICRQRFNHEFERLRAEEREAFLQDLVGGRLTGQPLDLAAWFNGLVYPLFERGAFADPIYGGNRGKAAWKMIGYPGLPAAYAQDVVRYRGQPHPRSINPQSIQDFS